MQDNREVGQQVIACLGNGLGVGTGLHITWLWYWCKALDFESLGCVLWLRHWNTYHCIVIYVLSHCTTCTEHLIMA